MIQGLAALPAAAVAAAAGAVAERVHRDGVEPAIAAAAVTAAEDFCGRVLIARDAVQVVEAGGGWQALVHGPVRGIAGPHPVDIDAGGTGWVRVGVRTTVRYQAGLAEDWAALPPGIVQGIALFGAVLATDGADAPLPAGVTALWRPWRRVRIGARRA